MCVFTEYQFNILNIPKFEHFWISIFFLKWKMISNHTDTIQFISFHVITNMMMKTGHYYSDNQKFMTINANRKWMANHFFSYVYIDWKMENSFLLSLAIHSDVIEAWFIGHVNYKYFRYSFISGSKVFFIESNLVDLRLNRLSFSLASIVIV